MPSVEAWAPVRHGEGVIDIDVRQLREFFGKLGVVVCFILPEPDILKQENATFLEIGHRTAGYRAIAWGLKTRQAAPNTLLRPARSGAMKRRVRTIFRATEMRN